MAKLQENKDRQFELKTQVLAKRIDCEAQKDLIAAILVTPNANYWKLWIALRLFTRLIMGVSLLATTKIILNSYQKLCSVVSDEPEFHKHISESFRIYSELNKFILA